MSAALEVDALSVHIGSGPRTLRIVEDVSFSVERGRAFGLVGESGSGKSMTLRALLGLLPSEARVTGGSIRLDGTELVGASRRKLRDVLGPQMTMVFQEPMTALNPVMRVGAQIAEGPRVHEGLSRSAAGARAVELMRRVGIPDAERRARAFPHQFSGGMRQRVMIAIAISCSPHVILCDEPTTALDVTIQDQILRLLEGLCDETGTALVFVTHDLPVVSQVCQTIGVMYAGRIVEKGDVASVFRHPMHPYTQGLLRSAPDFDERRASLLPIAGSPPSLVSLPSGCSFHPRCPYASDDCSAGELPLVDIGGRLSACRHVERVVDADDRQPVRS